MPKFELKHYFPKETIFLEGDPANAAYILKEGDVEISTKAGDKRIVLSVLKPVSIFGEMGLLLDNHSRTATATAKTRTSLVEVSKDEFHAFLENSPPFVSSLVSELVGRLKETTARSTRVPDVFDGVCHGLNAFTYMPDAMIPLNKFVNDMADAFLVDPNLIRDAVNILKDGGLISLESHSKHKRVITFEERHSFIERARGLKPMVSKMSRL